MPPRSRGLVVEILSRAANFRIDVAEEALAPDISDEGGVDRRIFDIETAGLEPADQPFAMSASFGEAEKAEQVGEEIRAGGFKSERRRPAERFRGRAEVVLRELDTGDR
jgi:hypothetical protein